MLKQLEAETSRANQHASTLAQVQKELDSLANAHQAECSLRNQAEVCISLSKYTYAQLKYA